MTIKIRTKAILNNKYLGGETERVRANEFFKRLTIVPDQESSQIKVRQPSSANSFRASSFQLNAIIQALS